MEKPVFSNARLNERLAEWDRRGEDGQEKGWVHDVQLAWLRHYQRRRRGRVKDGQFLRRYASLLEEHGSAADG